MTMRKIPATPIILLLLAPATLAAQTRYTRTHMRMLDEAKLLLAVEDYAEAAKVYKRLEPVDTTFAEVSFDLGLCYSMMPGHRDKAGPLFERALRHGHAEASYQLALVRHRQHRFEESIQLFITYRSTPHRVVNDKTLDRMIAKVRTAQRLTADPVDVAIRNMGDRINSPAHDYCPLVTADGRTMYFTSRREGTGGLRDLSGQYFEDIYMAHCEDGIWSNAVNAGPPLNSALQDATVGLSPDGSSMIVYRTGQGLISGDLFETRRVDGIWSTPERMTERINSPYHEPSASISPDGNEIYFTSDRPGGYGGRDLYRIRRLPNGQWSLPLNLGPRINTPHDEDAPFLHSDGITLFFSSTGHDGMGGYDIFKSTLLDADRNSWSAPENMGYPLNTVNDDIYFCMSEDGETGYFSSERPGGLGAQDIYQVRFPSSQLEYALVRGLVVDGREEPVRARIVLEDEADGDIVGIYNTNARTGRFIMVLAPRTAYRYRVEAEGYAVEEGQWPAKDFRGTMEMTLDVHMRPQHLHERLSRNER